MSILDTTIVNVAIETLARDLDASLTSIQWVSTGYLLALATVIPLTGWAMERFGGRRMWMISVILFLVGSGLCGLAWSVESLIVFRVLQGFGGGMIMPIGQAILAQAAGPQRMGRVMSVIGVPTLLGPILGPVIGGADRRQLLLALDLLRQPAGGRGRAGARRTGSCRAPSVRGTVAARRARDAAALARARAADLRALRGRGPRGRCSTRA